MDSLPTVGTACTLYRSGARLQLIDDHLPRDHFPVLIRFEVATTFVKKHHVNGATKWDFDKISKAFRTGNGIKQFVDSLNDKWSLIPEHAGINHQDMTKEWESIVADISQAAKPFFEKKNKPYHTPEYLELANTRDKLLMIQRQVKDVASSTYDDVSAMLKDIRKQLRNLAKRMNDSHQQTRIEELYDTWKSCEFSPMWKNVHSLTRKFTGPRHRKYNVHTRCSPSKQEWETHLQQEATMGGMTATTIPSMEDFLHTIAEGTPQEMDHNYVIMARRAVKGIRWALHQNEKPVLNGAYQLNSF
jgi:uncharacterized protein YoxC